MITIIAGSRDGPTVEDVRNAWATFQFNSEPYDAPTQKLRRSIRAIRDIEPGEELFYDYGLVIDEPYTPKLKAEYPCWCGAKTCRGTLLAPKRPQWRKR